MAEQRGALKNNESNKGRKIQHNNNIRFPRRKINKEDRAIKWSSEAMQSKATNKYMKKETSRIKKIRLSTSELDRATGDLKHLTSAGIIVT